VDFSIPSRHGFSSIFSSFFNLQNTNNDNHHFYNIFTRFFKKMKFSCIFYTFLLSGVSSFSFPARTNAIIKSNTCIHLLKNNAKNPSVAESVVIQGVGDEGCALPSPSGINTLDKSFQAAVFFGIFAVLGVSTASLSSIVSDATTKYEWLQNWRYTWPLLGAIYAAAGVTHFTVQEEYENIYPAKGSWGIWYLPGSKGFHVQWTGVAEFLGGVGLLIGGAIDAFAPTYISSPNIVTQAGIESDSAAGLFLLTLAVTPANIYMFTHGARLPKDGPEVPIAGHAVRGIFQVILLTMLYQMGLGTFDEFFS
jgi:uncharacterized membrane protein